MPTRLDMLGINGVPAPMGTVPPAITDYFAPPPPLEGTPLDQSLMHLQGPPPPMAAPMAPRVPAHIAAYATAPPPPRVAPMKGSHESRMPGAQPANLFERADNLRDIPKKEEPERAPEEQQDAGTVRYEAPKQAAPATGGGGPAKPSVLDEARDTIRSADEQAHKGVELKTEAEREAARIEGGAANEVSGLQRVEAVEDKIQKARQEHDVELQRQRIESIRAEKEAMKEDPNRLWNSMATWQKIGTAISLALGAFGSSLAKAPNYAAEMFDKEIDRDIAAQRNNIRKKGDELTDQRGVLADMWRRFGDEHQATLAARIVARDAIANRTKIQLADVNDKRAQASGALMLSELERKNAEDQIKLDALALRKGGGGGGAGGPGAPKEANQRFIAEKLGTAAIPEGLSAIDKALAETPKTGDIEGVGPILASPLRAHMPAVHKWVYGKDASNREQDYADVENAAMRAMSGSGVSGPEQERLMAAYRSANDADSRRNALGNIKRTLLEKQATILAGVPETDVAEYYRKKGNYSPPAAASGATPKTFQAAGSAPAGGKAAPSDPYETRLSPDEEERFRAWKQRYAPKDSGEDYDLRGAFKAGLTPDPKTAHWPDTFKKPNHETFSNESKYAVGENAARAGHWVGDMYVPPPGRRKK